MTSKPKSFSGKEIEDEVAQRAVTQADGERIGITVGWHGRQRTHERDHIHYMATVNNLMDFASKQCLANKKSSQEADRVSPIPEAHANDFSAPINALSGLSLPLRTSLPLPLIDSTQEDQTISIPLPDASQRGLVGRLYLRCRGIRHQTQDPGSPWQNGFRESFHGKFRDEFLAETLFVRVAEARVLSEGYRREDNEERPHQSLGYKTPHEYKQEWLDTHSQPDGD